MGNDNEDKDSKESKDNDQGNEDKEHNQDYGYGSDDMHLRPTSAPTFEYVECIEDKDCDGYRMECNRHAQCVQMSSGRNDGKTRIAKAAEANDGKNEQMLVYRSRVIYVDDVHAMLTSPLWLSAVALLLMLLVARPVHRCWARREYKH